MESVVDGRSLHFSTVYRISLRPPLRDRVKDLAEYSPDSYGAAMGGLVDTMPPEGKSHTVRILKQSLELIASSSD